MTVDCSFRVEWNEGGGKWWSWGQPFQLSLLKASDRGKYGHSGSRGAHEAGGRSQSDHKVGRPSPPEHPQSGKIWLCIGIRPARQVSLLSMSRTILGCRHWYKVTRTTPYCVWWRTVMTSYEWRFVLWRTVMTSHEWRFVLWHVIKKRPSAPWGLRSWLKYADLVTSLWSDCDPPPASWWRFYFLIIDIVISTSGTTSRTLVVRYDTLHTHFYCTLRKYSTLVWVK